MSSLQRVAEKMIADSLSAAPVLMTGEGDADDWTEIGILSEDAGDEPRGATVCEISAMTRKGLGTTPPEVEAETAGDGPPESR
jgi:hypothetical protein